MEVSGVNAAVSSCWGQPRKSISVGGHYGPSKKPRWWRRVGNPSIIEQNCGHCNSGVMPIEEVMKQFHATKVSVMEATRACPYAFPKKIQEEMDRLADEQMLKLKE